MQSLHSLNRPAAGPDLSHRRSGGAVIIITLTLLSTMVFLGFFFFGFTDLSQKTAQAYAEAEDYEIDVEPILDGAHEQLLVGVRNGFEESVLWGNKHSILPHIVGPINPNLQPLKDSLYSGTGIALVFYDHTPSDPNTHALSMDYDGDGVGDDLLDNDGDPDIAFTVDTSTNPPSYTAQGGFRINYSRVAQLPGGPFQNDAFWSLPNAPIPGFGTAMPYYDPAVGYTYPDLNSLFLAHDGYTTISNGVDPPVTARVVIPSFFRPQLMMHCRDANGAGSGGPGLGGFSTVFTSAVTRSSSLRPHEFHLNYNNSRRFVLPTGLPVTANSGNTNRILRPFPFVNDVNLDGVFNEFGVFSSADPAGYVSQLYEYDVDVDNDGVRDAIWMDLGLQLIDLPDGRQVVPLVAFKVLDADGLLNVNAHGNLAGMYFNQPDDPAATLMLDRNGNLAVDAGDARYPLHRSNMGLTASEVNPTFALFGDITADLQGATLRKTVTELTNHGVPVAALSGFPRPAVGCAELSFILSGRVDGTRTIPGRHGEEDLLAAFFIGSIGTPPRAGVTWTTAGVALDQLNSDDNQNMTTSGGIGYLASNPLLNGIASPSTVHPLPLTGTGGSCVLSSGAGARRLLSTPAGTNPSVWPSYTVGHWHDQAAYNTPPSVAANYNIRPYTLAGSAPQSLMTAGNNDLVDEDSEMNLTESFQNSSDAPFSPSENAGLQLTEADFSLINEESRLRDLASFNLRDSTNAALPPNQRRIGDASANRKKFTTDSWDRKEFGRENLIEMRPWEFSAWTSGSSTFNGITFTAGELHFPPEFGTGGAADVGTAADPFRSELRQLLWTRNANMAGAGDLPNFKSTRQAPQHRLNLNALLDGFDSQGNPRYRPLVPHPVFESTDTVTIQPMYHGQGVPDSPSPPFSAISNTSAAGREAMEWWARYDRQRMARDIYTLLWTVSGGNDLIDYAKTNPPADTATMDDPDTSGLEADTFDATTAEGRIRVLEMAQFAVNVVDALDPDDVITRFEFDPNLADGWSVPSPADNVVYGVETAQLTFSEVMLINCMEKTSDFNTTLHDDSDPHQFLFIELRNASPFPVPLEDESWRIVRVPRGRSVPADLAAATDADRFAAVKFKTGPTPKSIGPGETFLIGCHDGRAVNGSGAAIPSDFYADFDGGGLDVIVPTSASPSTASSNTTVPLSGPLCDLDIASTDVTQTDYFEFQERIGPATAMPTDPQWTLVGAVDAAGTFETEFDLVLQRRRNLHARGKGEFTAPPSPPGPAPGGTELWVEVDRFQILDSGETDVHPFNPATDSPADVNNALAGAGGGSAIVSFERPEPFYPDPQGHSGGNARNHSLRERTHANKHDKNETLSGTAFSAWQPHFNRPFASVMDLLSIPLYGHQGNSNAAIDVLGSSAQMDDNEKRRIWGPTQNLAELNGTTLTMSGHRVAAIRFQYPEPHLPTELAAAQSAGATTTDYVHSRNRWYRFLEFVEVPDYTDRFANGRSAFQARVPGRINLNTIRHESVLAGIIDDLTHLNPITNFVPQRTDLMTQDVLTTASAAPENVLPIGAFTPNPFADGIRNWFRELLQLRDGIDPILSGTGISATIPGTLERFERINPASMTDFRVRMMGAAPFRSLSHIVASADENARDVSINSTILRSRPLVDGSGALEGADLATADIPDHGIFEARHQADRSGKGGVPSSAGENSVDYHTRNRLLAKVHNRTTNRSHVFFVWTGIGFFEAHRIAGAGGQVQIGAQAEDIPVRRAFMVCDMSRIEEAYNDQDPTDAAPGTFDFRKFIIYRKLIK